jgi:UDP-3-O-[3-hydroxymyristoyl] glucosamine N-acyltransferase
MHVTTSELAREFAHCGVALAAPDSVDRLITRIAAIEEGGPGDLVFVDKACDLPRVAQQRPSAIITHARHLAPLAGLADTTVLTATSLSLAHALIKQRHGARDYAESGWEGVHPSAVIHESAEIGSDTVIEPRVVIGRHVRIGARCRIMAGTVIENDVVIGDDTVIHPLVVVGYRSVIGSQVVIESGSVIGSQGFGFAQDASRRSHPIPQTGIVVIEDRVRIGANNCIDRATYQVTHIGAGTKFDNLCHIAHNVSVGEDCLLTAMLCVAGSSKIGNRVMTSGQTGIIDHVEICDDVVLVHRAGVVKDISEPGVHASLPALPLDEYLRNTAVARTGPALRKRVAELEKAAARQED